jgi:conjugative relaxase-like TrwC/TraI family protein
MSAPKSVSVLYALGSAEVAATVRAAHETAVAEALAYLDLTCGHGLRGHQGGGRRARRIATNGLIAVGFTHRTSRAADPQLHTHLVLPNLVHGADRKWSALDSRAIYLHATTASYLYQAVLRGELTKCLGVDWTRPAKGIAEITGIPRQLRKLFSTRREQIEAELDRLGLDDPAAAQQACLSTRPAKPRPVAEPGLREGWAQQAREAGHDPEQLWDVLQRRAEPPVAPSIEQLTAELLSPSGLTKHRSSFDARDVTQALCQALPPGTVVDADQLQRWTAQILASPDVVRLQATGPEPGYSTAELLQVESRALLLADQAQQRQNLELPQSVVRAALDELEGEQGAVVASLLAEPRGLHFVVGPAGTGKTTTLAVAARAWRAAGVPVAGAALAAKAALHLEAATGIPSTSLARLLDDLDRVDPDTGRPAGLAPRSVLVVDEAGMVGTRVLARLLTHTEASGASLVLVGDPRQLSEIEAGGLFTALVVRGDPSVLRSNQRQPEAWERAALANLRAGSIRTAAQAYLTHGRVHAEPEARLSRTRLVADYIVHRARADDPSAVVILAARRADTRMLNDLVRTWLIGTRALGDTAITVDVDGYDREFRVGDEVLVTRNDYRLGVLNGTRGTVTAVESDRLQLAVDSGRRVDVSVRWLATGRLDHSYAMTVHKSQGLTVDVALLYGTTALSREASYVGLSRGRRANHVYLTAPIGSDRDQDCGAGPGPDRLDEPDVREELVRRLQRSCAQRLASSMRADYSDPTLGPESGLSSGLDRQSTRAEGLGR